MLHLLCMIYLHARTHTIYYLGLTYLVSIDTILDFIQLNVYVNK